MINIFGFSEIDLTPDPNHRSDPHIPSHQRGGSRSSRNAGRDAVDARRRRALFARGRTTPKPGEALWAKTGGRVRRSRVVLTPRRWRQVPGELTLPGGDGGKKARSPGRARRKPLKPLRREGRTASAEPVCSCALFYVQLAHETAGAARTRLSPRPLLRVACALFLRAKVI